MSDELHDLIESANGAGADLPDEVAEHTATLLGVTDASYAVIGSRDRRLTLSASSERARSIDRWQFTLNEGPCLDAALTGEAHAAPTAVGESPWPELAAKARELGYREIAGVPLRMGPVTFGALNLQSKEARITEAVVDRAIELADSVAPVIVTRATRALTDTTTGALDRARIHQATGLVAYQLGVSTADALEALRARAFAEDVTLGAIAESVVDRRVRFDRPGGDES